VPEGSSEAWDVFRNYDIQQFSRHWRSVDRFAEFFLFRVQDNAVRGVSKKETTVPSCQSAA
jgi:hypothetical protein